MSYDIDFSLASNKQLEMVLCKRVAQIRLSRNITQKMLANEAGVTSRTIRHLENGDGVSMNTFIRVLIALGLQDNLKNLLPDPSIRPIERVESAGYERKRARPTNSEDEDTPWSWSD